jgi:beta-aspartyl-peptidase (threonine type)
VGTQEMDASVMDGRDRRAGAVAGIFGPRNPVLAARTVMEHSPHVLLIGEGALAFCREQRVPFAEPGYFSTEERLRELREALEKRRRDAAEEGTVGAVARDRDGNLAAATSTGGMTGKTPGRGGVVAVDRTGALALPFNTSGMYRGYVRTDGAIRTAIWDEPYLLG